MSETNETLQKIIEFQSELREAKNEIIKLREEVLRELQQSKRHNAGVNAIMLGFSIIIFATALYYQKYGIKMTDTLFAAVYIILMGMAIYAIWIGIKVGGKVVKTENSQG